MQSELQKIKEDIIDHCPSKWSSPACLILALLMLIMPISFSLRGLLFIMFFVGCIYYMEKRHYCLINKPYIELLVMIDKNLSEIDHNLTKMENEQKDAVEHDDDYK